MRPSTRVQLFRDILPIVILIGIVYGAIGIGVREARLRDDNVVVFLLVVLGVGVLFPTTHSFVSTIEESLPDRGRDH